MEPLTVPVARRALLAAAGGAAWLAPLARALARQAELAPREPPRSVILLWLSGGPSQLETFDPHPGRPIAGGTKAIDTRLPGVQVAAGLEQFAEQMHRVSLVRSLMSKEGDHARGAYLAKSGYNPDPTALHPSLGANLCHELPDDGVEIPRHISILPDNHPGIGGFLGNQYDAFKMGDPAAGVPDVRAAVTDPRLDRRLADLDVIERAFARRRQKQVEALGHRQSIDSARRMMRTEQLTAFDIAREPRSLVERYGDTPFGRGCLAARRLIEVGVRCVEVTLAGWDSHVNNHAVHSRLVAELDPALAALLVDLAERDLLERTLVLCGGEFGRTPKLNALEGRDHWTNGFSILLAGGGLAAGRVLGATDPEGGREVVEPYTFADIHATVYHALGIDFARENISPVGRPLKVATGTPIAKLLA